jgi:selenide, water dikinase
VLRQLPASTHPDLLVGFDTSDDAGVFRLPGGQALVQTVDFFTPVVDDPYAYGQIAAANALSDVYAMGGRPITVLNIACFNPTAAPAEVWASVLKGAYDKTTESGAVVAGGHSVEDEEPKFGMAVTGLVDPDLMFANTNAAVGDKIYLTKPLGTGIVTTAAKYDRCDPAHLEAAIESMATLNKLGAELATSHGVRCATDITGFGIAGHLWNVARASGVRIRISASSLPLLPGVQGMIADEMTTGGAAKNRAFIGDALSFDPGVPEWLHHIVLDPQTSGGLAIFCVEEIEGFPLVGQVIPGEPGIELVA